MSAHVRIAGRPVSPNDIACYPRDICIGPEDLLTLSR